MSRGEEFIVLRALWESPVSHPDGLDEMRVSLSDVLCALIKPNTAIFTAGSWQASHGADYGNLSAELRKW